MNLSFGKSILTPANKNTRNYEFLSHINTERELKLPSIAHFKSSDNKSEKSVTELTDINSFIEDSFTGRKYEQNRHSRFVSKGRKSTLDMYISDPKRHKIKHENDAFQKYRNKWKELMILPVPLGLNYNSKQPKNINAGDYRMGPQYLAALNEALSVLTQTEGLNLRNNRLSGEPAKRLLLHPKKPKKKRGDDKGSKIQPDVTIHWNIATLDLSKNPLLPFEVYHTLSTMVEDGYNLLMILFIELFI